ncbi:endonuclease [Yeosuana sp. MJ-SS3]|uniref:Endonuclease n=1 Tax=Gilvirhabdus luticola TaxID=3079858 RepID=A0ABU3U7R9_9FLAO|nr:endonuclease [Yeosuana sp. MJ-SS3]MDU8886463.1 endonuclease [Yeosuana sp. MJ-SS3]
MKHIYFLFLLTSFLSFAQPTGYYDWANGRNGYPLKTALKEIIDANNDGLSTEYLSVDNGYGGLYITYETSDRDNYFEDNGTVLDMYSERVDSDGNNLADNYEYTYEIENPDDRDSGSGGTSEGEYYNREHVIPQSVFDSDDPMRNDAHFVIPSDKFVNAQRGNFPFGVVDSPDWTSTNGSKRGNNLNSGYSAGYTNTVFEPIDEFKGDIARMFFYFVTRYEDDITGFNTYDMFDGSSDKVFNQTFLNILYQWHLDDPVSIREQDRNNAIFARQNNRNPFIDHPEYVQQIWSASLSTENNYNSISVSMYPNPVKNNLHFSTTQDLDLIIYDVLGKKVLIEKVSSDQNSVDVSSFNKGIYLVRLISENGQVTKKLIKQ